MVLDALAKIVMLADALVIPLRDAVILVAPTAPQMAKPVEDIVATAELELAQVTKELTSPV
jgi:hypothetical protein